MSATTRFRVDVAPDELALVQDLVNTGGVPAYDVRDLLASVTDARRWAHTWSAYLPGIAAGLDAVDLPALAQLRREVRSCIRGQRVPVRSTVGLVVGEDGRLRIEPVGDGADAVAGAVWGQVLLAQRDDTWRRLKICRHQPCPVAFFDRSRNASRVWHDVRTCGNAVNLRASRERRRASSDPVA